MNNKLILEKKLLISIIGFLEAIYTNCISISESESYIFSPRIVKMMNELNISPSIILIIEKGCELEDIESLLPEKLMITVCDLKNEAVNLLMKYEEIDGISWIKYSDLWKQD